MANNGQSVTAGLWRQKSRVYVLLIVAGIGLGAITLSDYQTASGFSANAVEVTGTITHMSDYTNSNRKTFRISYTFATAADPYNNGTQLVSEGFYRARTDGGPIGVLYLPSDPTLNVVELARFSSRVVLTMMIASGLIVAGLVGGGFAIARARAHLRKAGR